MKNEYLDRVRNLDPVNRATLEKYIRKCKTRKFTSQTIQTKIWRIYGLLKFLEFKDLNEVTKENIEDYIIPARLKQFLSTARMAKRFPGF